MRGTAKTAVLTVCLLLTAVSAAAADFGTFVKDLRAALFTVQGKAKLFGFTQEFAFADVKTGAFKPGDIVLIKGKPSIAAAVAEELYDDVAYGEVDDVKGSVVKVFITTRMKAIPQDAAVVGLKRLDVQLVGAGDITEVYGLFLQEKELRIVDAAAAGNVKIHLTRLKDGEYGYRVVSAAGRIVLVGSFTTSAASRLVPSPTAAPIPGLAGLALNDQTGDYWFISGDTATCHTCETTRSKKIALAGPPVSCFFDGGKMIVWDGAGKTLVLGDTAADEVLDGYLLHGGNGLFDRTGRKIYDRARRTVLAETAPDIDLVYHVAGDKLVGRTATALVLEEKGRRVASLPFDQSAVVRVKKNRLYIYREETETVPLAGTYVTLVLGVYDGATLAPLARHELAESLVAFDIDEKSGDLVMLKKDGTIKRRQL